MSKRKTSIPKSTRFEDAMQELESVVKQLESGEQTLDQSLQEFERGVALARFCQQALDDANQKVQILLQAADGETLTDFKPAEDA